MNALQGLKQDWNNLRLSFTSPSKAEISASIEKIQRLDFWKNLTTTLSISLMPASVTVPFLAPYRKRDGTRCLPFITTLRILIKVLFFQLSEFP